MKNILISIRMLLTMTILLGLLYPLLMTFLGTRLFHDAVSGSLVKSGDQAVGSLLIGQKFTSRRYFWSRPSAVDYNTLSSGGSNLGLTSADLLKAVDERKKALTEAHGDMSIPQDLLFASGSGLDPHISPEAARYQVSRVAKERGLEISVVQGLVEKMTEDRQLGFLGEPRVNVLALNLALDNISK